MLYLYGALQSIIFTLIPNVMKKKLSFISHFSYMAFLLFITSCVTSCSQDDNMIDNMPKEKTSLVSKSSRTENEKRALDIATGLNNSFKTLTKAADGRSTYPDYFGGATIGEDGHLIVYIKGDTIKAKIDLESRSQSSDFTIKSCEYSLNELTELKSQLAELFNQDQYTDELTWVAVGISPKKNRIIVRLEDCSAEKIALFKSKISNSPAIIFEEGQKAVSEMSITEKDNDLRSETPSTRGIYAINPGGRFNVLSYNGSVGYRALYLGNEGFVTAGHCMPKVDGIAYYNGSYAGDGKIYSLGPKVDAAFIQTKENYDVTDYTEYGHKYITPSVIPLSILDGASVTMEGQQSAIPRSGIVNAIDVTVKYKGTRPMPYLGNYPYTVNYLVEATFSGQGGDSGGIVYGTTNNRLAGCYSGHTDNYRYFSYAGYINDLFNLTPY